jgi:hypothetical protein
MKPRGYAPTVCRAHGATQGLPELYVSLRACTSTITPATVQVRSGAAIRGSGCWHTLFGASE